MPKEFNPDITTKAVDVAFLIDVASKHCYNLHFLVVDAFIITWANPAKIKDSKWVLR